jgi:L-iditol 2-dehydrogenase
MKAAVLSAVGRIEVRDVPVRQPGRGEVLLKPRAVGLCGTDFHIFEGHANYNTDGRGERIPLADEPQVLGHEIVATVADLGPGVTALSVGDDVVVDQGIKCLSDAREPRCEYCATGDSQQCVYYREHGITGLPGGLAEYVTMPAVNAIPIADDVARDHAALTEPLGCIVHASDMVARAHARYALDHSDPARRVRTVLVSGAGPAGLLFVQYLRQALGWQGRILVIDPNPLKRALAAGFEAEPIELGKDGDVVSAVQDLTNGCRAEYLIDASGVGTLFKEIPGVLRKQGTVLLYGHGHAGVDLSVLNNVQFLEPTLVSPVGASGGFLGDGRPATYQRALDLIASGRVQAAPIITHRYSSLDQVPAAFAGAHHAADYVKGIVQI